MKLFEGKMQRNHKHTDKREIIFITRIWKGNCEGFELALNLLEEKHGFFKGSKTLLLIFGQHLTISFHGLVNS